MSNNSERRIILMLEQFNTNLQGRSIEDYFNINSNIQFRLRKNKEKERSCLFSFKYEDNPLFYNISNLPQDINRYIKTYIHKRYDICFELLFPMDYPFKPPQWVLNTPINHKQLYEQLTIIIKIHNYKYLIDWSPWIMIEKDILLMVESLIKVNYSSI
jgi:ubiquitin-protein ligase